MVGYFGLHLCITHLNDRTSKLRPGYRELLYRKRYNKEKIDFLLYSSNDRNVYIIYYGVHMLSLVYLTKMIFLRFKNLKRQNDPPFFLCIVAHSLLFWCFW